MKFSSNISGMDGWPLPKQQLITGCLTKTVSLINTLSLLRNTRLPKLEYLQAATACLIEKDLTELHKALKKK